MYWTYCVVLDRCFLLHTHTHTHTRLSGSRGLSKSLNPSSLIWSERSISLITLQRFRERGEGGGGHNKIDLHFITKMGWFWAINKWSHWLYVHWYAALEMNGKATSVTGRGITTVHWCCDQTAGVLIQLSEEEEISDLCWDVWFESS